MEYGTSVKNSLGFEEAVERARSLLKEQGFGILCEIDVGKTLEEKTGAPFYPYRILGACNPQFARAALEREPMLGLLLPCNVVVQRNGMQTVVSAINARAMLSVAGNPELMSVADEVNARLDRVLQGFAAVPR
jgi:uncharacterized protein (DUF302 family)